MGRVRSLTRPIERPNYTKIIKGRIMSLRLDSLKRYVLVTLWRNKKPFTRLVHRLVWTAFRGDMGDKEINHINGVKTDNRLINLEAVTHSENERHKYKLGYKGSCYGKFGALHARSIAVEQIDLNSGNVIATYGSMSEAGRAINRGTKAIMDCCKGKQRSTGGYGWRYKDKSK